MLVVLCVVKQLLLQISPHISVTFGQVWLKSTQSGTVGLAPVVGSR